MRGIDPSRTSPGGGPLGLRGPRQEQSMVLLLFLAEEPLLPLPRRHEDHVPRLEPEKAGLFLEKIQNIFLKTVKNPNLAC